MAPDSVGLVRYLKMFKTRLLSIIFMLPLLLLALFKLQTNHLNYLVAFIVTLALGEWAKMLRLPKAFMFAICGLFLSLPFVLGSNKVDYILIFKLSTLFWFAVFLLLLRFPKFSIIWKLPKIHVLYFIPLFVPAYLAFSYVSVVFGRMWLLFGLCLIFSADSGAYVFGKLFGSKKMAPNISPGKTIAGLYGAMLSGILVSMIFSFIIHNEHYIWMSLLGLTTVLLSVNGDLAQSALKRIHGVKDSGTLIPGHGGVFDRLDSIVGAMPTFALCCHLLLKNKIISLGLALPAYS